MPSQSLRVDQLVDSSPRLSWQESVALVHSLAVLACSGSPTIPSSGTFAEFSITENGEVAAAIPLPQLSISELALLLARLLPGEAGGRATEGDERAPAGVHFAIARALGMVQAPTFADMEEFSAALGRFLRQDPTVSLRVVVERCASRASAETDIAVANVTARTAVAATSDGAAAQETSTQPAGHATTGQVIERRRTGPRAEVLRRMLRDEDRENYLYLVEQKNRAEATKRRTSPTPETLRRLLREADERNFVLKQAIEHLTTSERRPGGWRRRLGNLALGVMLVAGIGGVIELEHWQHVIDPLASTPSSSVPPAANSTKPPERDVAAQPAASPLQVPSAQGSSGRSNAPRTQPSTTEDRKSSVWPSPAVAAPAARIGSERVTDRAAPARHGGTVDRAGNAGRTIARPTFYDVTSGRKADADSRPSSAPTPTTVTTADDSTVKPTGAVPRFFSAVYRKLGRLVHRDPRARTGLE